MKATTHLSLTPWRTLLVGMGALLIGGISTVANAEDARIYGVISLPGQEDQTILIDSANVELVNHEGWICSGVLSSTPGKASAICRYNNASQSMTTYVNCGHEKMQTANLHMMEGLDRKASVTLICKQ